MLDDLAVPHTHGVDGFKMNPSTGCLHAQEWPLMRSVIRLIRRHEISVGSLPMDFSVEVGERAAPDGVQLSAAVPPRGRARGNSRRASLSGVRPGLGVSSTKSLAKSSSNTSKFPRLCPSSVLRRTTA